MASERESWEARYWVRDLLAVAGERLVTSGFTKKRADIVGYCMRDLVPRIELVGIGAEVQTIEDQQALVFV